MAESIQATAVRGTGKGKPKRDSMCRLEEVVQSATGEGIPEALAHLLTYHCRESDTEMRRFVYRSMFSFLSRERGVDNGASLVYPQEILDAVRVLYPDGIKDYPPRAGKRKRLYEVTLEELVQEYRTLKRSPSPEY
ncbi:partial [Paramuricea clavata]|uniref:Partial n=1 Tax=Paramuricea clavata TaxID=317549 RepID=A0A6S7H5P7_PARCT|nr:partial [Paramuricea clavata]